MHVAVAILVTGTSSRADLAKTFHLVDMLITTVIPGAWQAL